MLPEDLKNDGTGTIISKLDSGGGDTTVWTASRTWSAVYADIIAAGGAAIVLVPNDGDKEMTPNPSGDTDLSNVLFVGVPDADGNLPYIDIDSAGVGGFSLGGNHNIQSKDIRWTTYYRIGSGSHATWTFDGGGIASATAEDAYRHSSFNVVLSNQAYFDGSSCTEGLVSGITTGVSATLLTGAHIRTNAFSSNKHLPAYPGLTLTLDAGGIVDAGALNGPGSWVHLARTLIDAVSEIIYDDTAASPTTGFGTAQGILDYFKGLLAGGGQGLMPPVNQLVDLAALVTNGWVDGTQVFVNEVEDIYVLDTGSALTPDGVTVVAATAGGNWIARHHGRWDDMQGSIGQGAGVTALTVEVFRDTPFLMWFMRHDQNDALNFVYQFSHSWDYTKIVVPHLHVLPMADPATAQVARFDGYFAWTRPNYAAQPLPALTGWTAFGPIDLTINPGDVYVQKIISLGSITPPAWVRESSSLLIWFRRFGTDAGDTYTTSKVGGTQAANLGILSTDVHFRKNKIGSVTEIPI